MGLSEEQIQQFNETTNLKQTLKGGNSEGRNSIIEEILSQDKYKQQIMDGLLKIRRVKRPEKQDGEIVLQEYVRLQDGTGRWKRVSDIPEKQWQNLKKGGVVNEEGAKDVLTTLNGISNNNVKLSNLTQKQINELGLNAAMAIDNKLRNNKEEYGIESTDDIEWIMNDIVNPNHLSALSSAKNGNLVAEILREIRLVGSLDEDDEDSSGGILNYG